MYAEIKLDLDERSTQNARTEVVSLEAQVLEAVEENNRQIVSVRFTGVIREDSDAAVSLDEVWHLARPANGKGGWLIAGIQQTA
jgi:predicted lipid-binding transport protein (Tim44 family)